MSTLSTQEFDPEVAVSRSRPAALGENVGERIEQRLDAAQEWERSLRGPGSQLWSNLPRNVGRTDQRIRLGVGTACLVAAAFAPVGRGWRTALAVVGVAELLSGASRYCPLSHAFGVSTCEADER